MPTRGRAQLQRLCCVGRRSPPPGEARTTRRTGQQRGRDGRPDPSLPLSDGHRVGDLALLPAAAADLELAEADDDGRLFGNPDVAALRLFVPGGDCVLGERLRLGRRVRTPRLVAACLFGRCPFVNGCPVLDCDGCKEMSEATAAFNLSRRRLTGAASSVRAVGRPSAGARLAASRLRACRAMLSAATARGELPGRRAQECLAVADSTSRLRLSVPTGSTRQRRECC